MRRFSLLVLPLVAAAGLFAAQPAFAVSLVPEACQGTATLEECGLNEAVQVFINVAQFIFGISGSVALLMFIWGGFLWLTSAGNAEKVKQGQAVITGAVVGLIIIFGAYVGVQFIVTSLRGTVAPGEVMIPGERCGSGEEAGLAVYTGNPEATATSGLECIPFGQCGRIGEGWEEVTITESNRGNYTCVDGLLPSEAENVKCCRASGGGTGTGGSGDGPSSPPEGSSGRNNCTCANRSVTAVGTCGACVSFCTSRSSTMSEYLGAALTSCPGGGGAPAGAACTRSSECGPTEVCDAGRCTSVLIP